MLLEILLNVRCCFWPCCASFCFFCGIFTQIRQWQEENLGGKMAEHVTWSACWLNKAKCWNMSLDLLVLLMVCARKGQDIGQNRMRKVGKRENAKFFSHIYFRHLRPDICWIYVSNLLRRRFHRFHPFSPKRIRVSEEKAGRRGKTGHQSSSILDRCHPCTSERWGQTLDKF